jgi:AcrR family transcriptional regulator
MTLSKSFYETDHRTPLADGRRERSRSNHAKIIAAGIELLGKGEYAPSAARVAEVAGVGMRSVFRHFEDMDTLYRELGAEVELKVWPIMLQQLDGATWKERIVSLSKRRMKIFETIFHYRIAADLRRFDSPYLAQDHRRVLRIEFEMINACLSESARADAIGTAGIYAVLSFANWQSLRQDQELSEEDARDVVLRLLDIALSRFSDS